MNRKISLHKDYRETRGRREIHMKGVHVLRCLVVILAALNVLLLYVIFSSSQGLYGLHVQREQVKELENKFRTLEKENRRLFNKIQSLKQDSRAQERIVRQQLGWVRDNEIMIEYANPNPRNGVQPPQLPGESPGGTQP